MAHEIYAIVTNEPGARRFAEAWPPIRAVPVAPDWVLIPLTRELYLRIVPGAVHPQLRDLEDPAELHASAADFDSLLGVIADRAPDIAVAALVTQYFGGVGEQAAGAIKAGNLAMPTAVFGGAINLALELIGVVPAGDRDA